MSLEQCEEYFDRFAALLGIALAFFMVLQSVLK